MRLGLLGPSGGDIAGLGRAAEFLLNGARVHRAIYLGDDGALDHAVAAWARKLVGDDPSDEGAWRRAADVALEGSPESIDRFVVTERARIRLKALEALPQRGARMVERLGDRVVVLIHDEAELEEEDVAFANILLFGRSDGPLIEEVGARWYVTPGPIGSRSGGLAVIEDEQSEVVVTVFDASGRAVQRAMLTAHEAEGRARGEP